MKKIDYSLLLFVFGLLLMPMETKAIQVEAAKTKISLLGSGIVPVLRSSTEPVEAYIDDTSIEVVFQSDAGFIEIHIYNEFNELVYQESIDTSVQQEICIDILSLESGEYFIEFIDSQGRCLSGDFEI